ncbi:hypothetical protein J2T20_004037 [Paenibacillus wynnii]|nr:hypothetical protein [Paenibacillus wynnii]
MLDKYAELVVKVGANVQPGPYPKKDITSYLGATPETISKETGRIPGEGWDRTIRAKEYQVHRCGSVAGGIAITS